MKQRTNEDRDIQDGGGGGFMNRLKRSALYKIFLRFIRVLQFLSATISLGMFSSRVYKVLKLVKRVNSATGAVEGILAAAVLYTILATIIQLALRKKAPKWLRWLLVFLDICFVGAFIAVAVLTRPGGPSGPCTSSVIRNLKHPLQYQTANCKLPWGTFVLAIFSTILHAITAIFHEAKDHLRRNKQHDQIGHDQMRYDQVGHDQVRYDQVGHDQMGRDQMGQIQSDGGYARHDAR